MSFRDERHGNPKTVKSRKNENPKKYETTNFFESLENDDNL